MPNSKQQENKKLGAGADAIIRSRSCHAKAEALTFNVDSIMVLVDMLTLTYVLRQRYQQSCAQAVQAAANQSRSRYAAEFSW